METLYEAAFKHSDHLCNGLCPDAEGPNSPGMESRDPECFYCAVMTAAKELEWYGEQADAIARHMDEKKDLAVMACVTALALDHGNRAQNASFIWIPQEC